MCQKLPEQVCCIEHGLHSFENTRFSHVPDVKRWMAGVRAFVQKRASSKSPLGEWHCGQCRCLAFHASQAGRGLRLSTGSQMSTGSVFSQMLLVFVFLLPVTRLRPEECRVVARCADGRRYAPRFQDPFYCSSSGAVAMLQVPSRRLTIGALTVSGRVTTLTVHMLCDCFRVECIQSICASWLSTTVREVPRTRTHNLFAGGR